MKYLLKMSEDYADEEANVIRKYLGDTFGTGILNSI
tara:strand:+ start:509 stop:616 length:108 start_codon:yes stop_codon:yes gene_type:complete